MSAKNKTIIFITKSPARNASQSDAGGKIRVSSVDQAKLTENVLGEINWTPQTLDGILLKIKKDTAENARILLSEELVYTITLPATSEIPFKDNIRQIAQELIPENLNDTIWDFKQVTPNLVQVVAVNKALFAPFDSSIVKNGLRIEAIEPISIALARFTKKDTTSFYIFIEDEILFVLSQYGVVLATEHLTSLSVNAINEFIAFAKEKFNIEQKNVIFCGNTRGIDFNPYMNQSFKIEIQNINPVLSLAFKEDVRGKDEDVLNLLFPSSFREAPLSGATPESPSVISDAGSSTRVTKNVKKPRFSKTTLLAILLILAIVILVVLIIFKVYL